MYGDIMYRNKKLVNQKLNDLGKRLGLDDADIYKARKTIKHLVMVGIFAGLLGLVGYLTSQVDPVGQFYASVSIKDIIRIPGRLLY